MLWWYLQLVVDIFVHSFSIKQLGKLYDCLDVSDVILNVGIIEYYKTVYDDKPLDVILELFSMS